jgi:hypothetical protein
MAEERIMAAELWKMEERWQDEGLQKGIEQRERGGFTCPRQPTRSYIRKLRRTNNNHRYTVAKHYHGLTIGAAAK